METAAESALTERKLADYDCLFLCNVARFTAGEARLLSAYLHGGGGAVFFLGDRVQADNYNRELGPAGQGRAGGAEILPARLGKIVSKPQFRLDPLGFRHPILQAFRGRGENSLLTTPVFKYYQLSMPNDSAAATVLAGDDGDPLIVESRVGQGRVVLVATAPVPDWSALPLWPSFVPLVQEMTDFCAAGRFQGRDAVNLDPAESDLAPIEPAELRGEVWPDIPFRTQTLSSGADEMAVGGITRTESGLPVVLLYCALGLLFADSVFSWKLGRL